MKTGTIFESINVMREMSENKSKHFPQEKKKNPEMVTTAMRPQWVMKLVASQTANVRFFNKVQGNELFLSHSFKKCV